MAERSRLGLGTGAGHADEFPLDDLDFGAQTLGRAGMGGLMGPGAEEVEMMRRGRGIY
jgi:hypothetical protein